MAKQKKQKPIPYDKVQEMLKAEYFRGHKEGCKFTLERIHNALELPRK